MTDISIYSTQYFLHIYTYTEYFIFTTCTIILNNRSFWINYIKFPFLKQFETFHYCNIIFLFLILYIFIIKKEKLKFNEGKCIFKINCKKEREKHDFVTNIFSLYLLYQKLFIYTLILTINKIHYYIHQRKITFTNWVKNLL